jgi:hypothetical protein
LEGFAVDQFLKLWADYDRARRQAADAKAVMRKEALHRLPELVESRIIQVRIDERRIQQILDPEGKTTHGMPPRGLPKKYESVM